MILDMRSQPTVMSTPLNAYNDDDDPIHIVGVFYFLYYVINTKEGGGWRWQNDMKI